MKRIHLELSLAMAISFLGACRAVTTTGVSAARASVDTMQEQEPAASGRAARTAERAGSWGLAVRASAVASTQASMCRPIQTRMRQVTRRSPATFTQVFNQILNNTTMPTAATSPGCANCHDGVPVDGGSANAMISHSINYRDKAAAYIALVGTAIPPVGVDSLRCPGMDGGPAIKRVRPGNPDESVLVQKLRQGLGIGTACDGVAMPLNIPLPNDGGAGTDAGFTMHAITLDELNMVISWVNAGALNN